MKEYIMLFIKGAIIGVANAIPGVSGGTLAFILGVYEKLTNAIAIIPSVVFKPKEWATPLKTLIPIGVGAVVAIVAFLNIIKFLFANYAIPTQLFFVGLVLGSLPFIAKEIKGFGIKNLASFFLGATIMAIFIYFNMRLSSGTNTSNQMTYSGMNALYAIKLFVVSILAAATMVIPGMSGSLLLLMVGEYENVSSFMSISNIQIVPLIIVGLGVVVGLFSVTKLISIILHKYREQVFSFVLALIVVSLFSIMPNVSTIGTLPMVLASACSICLGFVLAIALEKL